MIRIEWQGDLRMAFALGSGGRVDDVEPEQGFESGRCEAGRAAKRADGRAWLAWPGLFAVIGCASTVALLGCQTEGLSGRPIVQAQRIAPNGRALDRVAVIPFEPGQSLQPLAAVPGRAKARSRMDIANDVRRFVAEALAGRGVGAIEPSDVQVALEQGGRAAPPIDPAAAVEIAASQLAATGVIVGRVTRFRERVGGAAGATRPASVAFEVSLFNAGTGRRLWRGQFDETQPAVTENVARVRQYPGRGGRWLSANELARWGAERMVQNLLSGAERGQTEGAAPQ